MWVYVGHAADPSYYGGADRRGQYFFEIDGSFNSSTGAARFKTWDAATNQWYESTRWEIIPGERVFNSYAESPDDYRLYRLYDFNCRTYGGWCCDPHGGSAYTLRYEGRLYDPDRMYLGHRQILPAGTRVHIPYGYGYTHSNYTSNRTFDLMRIKGYYDSSGNYHTIDSNYNWLDEPVVDYYPSSYNINTF
ncbi:hypothetical protein [Alkalihalobacillus sp. AL-G]|uniref:hypothetical protein n=1 Tax=Alkalihalobacillus sp. AL-G TaxID=2926399 RepID=UPI00272CC74C|nr:hypothetical protein [Alkalihalobacillus sp. AL-G]WLD92646.1 hypothetical protein MOJ78_16750 [Alkalihalobacillus sp. AL-G]